MTVVDIGTGVLLRVRGEALIVRETTIASSLKVRRRLPGPARKVDRINLKPIFYLAR
jgi:hypothetical protein